MARPGVEWAGGEAGRRIENPEAGDTGKAVHSYSGLSAILVRRPARAIPRLHGR